MLLTRPVKRSLGIQHRLHVRNERRNSLHVRQRVPRHSPIRASPIGKRLLTSAYLTLAYQDFRLSMSLPVFVTFAYHVHWPIRQVPIRLFMSLTKVLYWQFRHPEGYKLCKSFTEAFFLPLRVTGCHHIRSVKKGCKGV